MQEIWRPIAGFEGLYEVSDQGDIRSLDHSVEQLNRWGTKTTWNYPGMVLKPRRAKNGYLYVHLSKVGVRKTVKNHRVVAETFIPPIEGKTEVNHKDGCKQNNNWENLEWSTRQGNIDHAIETGLTPLCPFGRGSHNFKGDIRVYNSEGSYVETLVGHADIEAKGYKSCGVSSVVTGRCKTYRGMTFERIAK